MTIKKTPTSGPWNAQEDSSDDKGRYAVYGPDGAAITGWGNVRQLKHDALLIAAAPDLLAACNVALNYGITLGMPADVIVQLTTAINKARGQP